MPRKSQALVCAAWLLPAVLITLPRPLSAQPPSAAPAAVPPTAAAPAEPAAYDVAVDDLRAPTSPAFSILGVTPASVDRPQNAKALTLNLLSAANSGDGLPKNYALEITPYWFASHPNLTFSEYYSQSAGLSILRTLSISVATAPITPKAPADGTKVALGVRTMVVPGHANALLAQLRSELLAADKILLGGLRGLDGLRHERARAAARLAVVTDAARRSRLEQLIKEDDAKIEALEKAEAAANTPEAIATREKARADARALTARIRELDGQRDGFMLAIAAGQVWGFPGDSASDGSRTTAGVWATPSYRIRPCELSKDDQLDCQSSVDLIGVLRYLSDRTNKSDPSRWDIGGRFAWQINKPLALSIEAVRRNRPITLPSAAATHRTVMLAEYRVSDGTLVFASFGKDFDNADHKTLVTLIGLNFGLGKKPIIDLSK